MDWEREIAEFRRVGDEALIKSTEQAMALFLPPPPPPPHPPFSVLLRSFFFNIFAANPPILAAVMAAPIRDLARDGFWLVICRG